VLFCFQFAVLVAKRFSKTKVVKRGRIAIDFRSLKKNYGYKNTKFTSTTFLKLLKPSIDLLKTTIINHVFCGISNSKTHRFIKTKKLELLDRSDTVVYVCVCVLHL